MVKPANTGRTAAARALLCAFLALVVMASVQHGVSAQDPDAASVVEIILQIDDTTVSPLDDEYCLSVYLTNTLQEVAGVELTVLGGRNGLFRLPDSIRVETTIVCIDTLDCDPADTVVDSIRVSAVDLTGSVLADWEFVEARALSPYTFRLAAVADFPPGGVVPPPIATGGPHLLFRIVLEREASMEILDTLQDRTVQWLVTFPTGFSDPSGNSIGLQESTVCLNPPLCDSFYTVNYYDPNVNIYVDGSTTFGPNCIIGDVNGDGITTAADVVSLVNYVFRAGPEPGCQGAAGDVDCSGTVNTSDIVGLVNYIYKSGPAPCSI